MRRAASYSLKQLDPRDGMSPEEEEAYTRDVDAALTLLEGIRRQDFSGMILSEYLSANTKREQEARAALSRVLKHENVPSIILLLLARLFNPDPERDRRKLIFQNYLSQGRHDPERDAEIRHLVHLELHSHGEKDEAGVMRTGITLQQAYEAVAVQVGLSAEQVRRIYKGYGKRKRKLKK